MPINCGKIVPEHAGHQIHKSSDLALYNQEFTPKNQIGVRSYINQAIRRSNVYNDKRWQGRGASMLIDRSLVNEFSSICVLEHYVVIQLKLALHVQYVQE